MSKYLSLTTTMTRKDLEGDDFECDVLINFEIVSFSAGYAATRDEPGCGPEFEFAFTSAEFDGNEPSEAPGPITAEELVGLETKFHGPLHSDAYEQAMNDHDDDGPDPDEGREDRFERDRDRWDDRHAD